MPLIRLKRTTWTAVFLFLSCPALILSLYLFRGVLVAPLVKKALISTAESRLGMKITIGKVRGSFFSSLELGEVRTEETAAEGPLVELSLRRVRLTYRLLSLLSGSDAFVAGMDIDADSLDIHLDSTRLPPGEEEPPGGKELSFPPHLPSIRLRDGHVTLATDSFAADAGGVSVDVKPGGPKEVISLEVAHLSVTPRDRRKKEIALAAEAHYGPDELNLLSLRVDGKQVVEKARLGLTGMPDAISLEADMLLFGGKQILAVQRHEGIVDFRWEIDGLNLSLAAAASGVSYPMTGDIDSSGSARLDPLKPAAVKGSLTVTLGKGSFRDVDAAGDLVLEAGDGIVTIKQLQGVLGDNDLSLADVPLSIDGILQGAALPPAENARGAFSLRFRDAPALLGLAGRRVPAPDLWAPGHEIALTGSLGKSGAGVVDIERFSAFSGSDRLEGSGSFELTPPYLGRVELEASVDSVDGYLSPFFPPLLPPFGSFKGTATAHRKGETLHLERFQGRLGTNSLAITGGRIPASVITSPTHEALSSLEAEAFAVHLENIPAILARLGRPIPGKNSDLPPHQLKLEGSVKGRTAAISSGALETGNGRVSIHQAALTLPAAGESWKEVFIQAGMEAHIPEIGPMASLFGFTAGGKDLAGSLSVEGSLGSPVGIASLGAKDVSFMDVPVGDVKLEARSETGILEVERLSVRRGGDRLEASGSYAFSSSSFSGLSSHITIADVGSYLPPHVTGDREVRGRLTATVTGSGTVEDPRLTVEASLRDGMAGSVAVTAAGGTAVVEGRRIDLKLLEATTSAGSCSLAGSLNAGSGIEAFEADLRQLHCQRKEFTADLVRPARLSRNKAGDFLLQGFTFATTAGIASAEGVLAPSGSSDLTIRLEGFSGRGWLEDIAGDRIFFDGADAEARFSGTLDRPEAWLKGTVAEIGGPSAPFLFSGIFEGRYSERVVRLGRFELKTPNGHRIQLEGELPFDPRGDTLMAPGRLAVTGLAEVPDLAAVGFLLPERFRSGGEVKGDVELSGSWAAPQGRLSITARDISPPVLFERGFHKGIEIECDLVVSPRMLQVKHLDARSPEMELSFTGSWIDPPSASDLIMDRGRPPGGILELDGKVALSDIGLLVTPGETLRRLAGRIAGNVSVRGPASGPEVVSKFSLFDGELVHSLPLPSLSGVTLDLTSDGKEYRIESARGELGGAPLFLTGLVRQGDAGGYEIDLTARGENLLLYRSSGLKIRSDAELTLSGPLSKMRMAGTLALTDGAFTKNIDLFSPLLTSGRPKQEGGVRLFSLANAPYRDMIFDVAVTGGKPFRIKNNVIQGAVRPDLVLTGTGELPVLTGVVYTDPSKVILPTGRMNIESGTVRFERSDPEHPVIGLVGRSRMIGYDITMLVEGTYDEPVITLSSVPPLPEDDLLLLVLTGRPPATTAGRDATGAQGVNVAVYFGRNFLARWIGGNGGDDSVLDRFDVQVGRGVTRTGEPTIDSSFRLAEGIIQKSDTLYLVSEKDIYDDFNTGVKIVFRFR